MTVLLVDDEPTILTFVRRVLEKEGYDVICASSAKTALNHCQNSGQQISIVVTDVQMPEMSGRELAECAAAAMRPGIPILFMTGHILDSECRDPLTGDVRLDGNLIIRKPFRGEVMLAVIERLLRATAVTAANTLNGYRSEQMRPRLPAAPSYKVFAGTRQAFVHGMEWLRRVALFISTRENDRNFRIDLLHLRQGVFPAHHRHGQVEDYDRNKVDGASEKFRPLLVRCWL